MDMYRTFISIENSPDIWVMDVEANCLLAITFAIREYMSNFDFNYQIVSVGKTIPNVDVIVEDIILN